MSSMLGFKSGTSGQDCYIVKEAETEKCSPMCQQFVRKPTRMPGTPLGFSCTSLKQHSRHAASQKASSITAQPIPRSTTLVLECNSPVWKRDFSTSGGMATAQLKIPARPPAKRILGTLRSLTLWQDQSRVGGKSEKKI